MTTNQLPFTVIRDSATDLEFQHRIRPQDIEVRGCCAGGFGKYEVELSAGRLVLFFQSKGRWAPFTILELVEFYRINGWDPNKMFFGLSGIWYDDGMDMLGSPWRESVAYLVLAPDGQYHATNLFLEACMK